MSISHSGLQSFSAEKVTWGAKPEIQFLLFALGGRNLTALPFRALSVTTPFTKLSTDLAETMPPWGLLTRDIDAAVVPAQPIDTYPARLTFVPAGLRYIANCSDRYFVDLQGSYAAYMQKFSSKSRSELRRTVRKFAEHCGGQIRWREFRSPTEIIEFHGLAIEVSSKSWKVKNGGPGFPRSPEFGKRLAERARDERVRGYVLFHGDRPVTYIYYRVDGDHLVGTHVAYDDEYSWWSPGNVLFLSVVEKLFEEQRYRYLDFGDGTLSYKQFFSTNQVRCARIFYFRRTLRNLAIVGAHCALTRTSVGIGKAMTTLGLKQKIKRWMMGKRYRPGQAA
jgi:CelD/BcsL family acetyltransferase involved in cellulose biosynthesis